MPDRQGTTLAHRVVLSPGMNTLIATIGRDVAPPNPDERVALVVGAFASALGVVPEFVGTDSSGMTEDQVWVTGQGRPVYIGEVGEGSKRFDEWYARKGSPSGPSAHYISLHVDWRGPRWQGDVNAGLVAFPGGTSPKVISSNWPDGDAAEQATRLAREKLASDISQAGAAAVRAGKALDSFIARFGLPLGIVFAGVFALVLALKLGKRT